MLRPGQALDVSLLQPGKLTLVKAEIAAVKDATLALSVRQPSHTIWRRRDMRYDCALPVSLHDQDTEGAKWENFTAVNISLGGLLLQVPQNRNLPARLVARLDLRESSSAARPSSASGVLEVNCYIRNRRPLHDGLIGVGLAFEALKPQQEYLLAAYITSILQTRRQSFD